MAQRRGGPASSRIPPLSPGLSAASLPLGEIAALGAAALWAVSTIIWTRQMEVSWPQAMNLFKTGLCLPLFIVTLLATGAGRSFLEIGAPAIGILLVSGIIGMSLGDTAYFSALTRIGARRTMLIQCLAPLFAALLSAALGEPLPGAIAASGVLLVLLGLILVLRERPVGVIHPSRARSGILLAMTAALCQALGIVLTKKGLAHATVLQASTIRIAGGVMGILLLELLHGQLTATVRHALRPPSLGRIVPAALMGSFLGFFLFQEAVRHTEPAVAAALTGTSPLFVAPLSVLFLGEMMRAGGWVGTILAVAGVVVAMLG
ncbi:MAG: DMT family transporter [Candidatus Eisenbacteria bacterium]|nr:DMT family transporter [Candidatus Eisenbacteria bacterium]